MNAPVKPNMQLPALLQIAVNAGGMDAALGLVKRFGGQFVYIPRKARDTHPLVKAMGRKGADAIIHARGGEHCEIPTIRSLRRPLALALIAAGEMSNNQIAEATGLTNRDVRRMREWHRMGVAPGSMPAAPRVKRRAVDPRQIDIEHYLK